MDEEGYDFNAAENVSDCICAICDNGGYLMCCEGRCRRSFHPTLEAGDDSLCVTLDFLQEEIDDMPKFICKNCQYKKHQCFVCGNLGSSDDELGAEVFQCVSADCGYFYHPHCVATLLHQGNEVAIQELENRIAAGESFTCPIHKCCVCNRGENMEDPRLQFAICRRCPKSYHRNCLPRAISVQDIDEDFPRAWEGILPNRIQIYCLNHEIDEVFGTPIRDHIKFPGVNGNGEIPV